MNKFSVIIPVLNEEFFLGKNLCLLKKFNDDLEIIVVDGGSTDSTKAVCKKFNIKYFKTEKNRGLQFNKGSENASGNILIFLHADSFLPENSFDLINKFFINKENKVCRFKLKFDIDNKFLSIYSYFSKFDNVFTRFGDTAIIIKKDYFFKIGGFKNISLFEDVDFLSRVSRFTKVGILNNNVISSSRKYIYEGIIKNQIKNGILFINYFMGESFDILYQKYFSVNNKKEKNALIIFARYPEKGKVKKRLSKGTSPDFSKFFYDKCASNIFYEVNKLKNWNIYLFYSDEKDKLNIKKWTKNKYLYWVQEGENLGERMSNAFDKVLSHYNDKAIIIGTDIPELNCSIIKKATEILDNSDLVIGPSEDGGYYLLGMKKNHYELFKNIEWSTASVLKNTLNIAASLSLKFETLEKLGDIDTKEDMLKWMISGNNNKLKRKIKNFSGFETLFPVT